MLITMVPPPTVAGERSCELLQLPRAMPFETAFCELASEVLSAEAFIALNAAWPLTLLMLPSTKAEAAEPELPTLPSLQPEGALTDRSSDTVLPSTLVRRRSLSPPVASSRQL